MLNYDEIAKRIEIPSLLRQTDVEDLKQLMQQYPYAAVFTQLYLKALSLYDTIQFDTALTDFAFRIPDRSRLYFMVNEAEENHAVEEELTQAKEATSDTSQSDFSQETQTVEAIQEEERTEKATIIESSDSSVDDDNKVQTDTIETPISQEEQEKVEEKSSQEKKRAFNELERDILAHAVSSSILLEANEEPDEAISLDELRNLDVKKTSPIEEEEPNEEVTELPTFDLDLTSHRNDHPQPLEENLQTFTSWITHANLHPNDSFKQKKEDERSENPKIEQEKIKSKEKNKEIFSGKRREATFFSPAQKAKESLDESTLPVSETLAKIYAAQGNYPKAITAYEKLMLKNPKKKTYFALQIEILKKKIITD